MSNKLKGFASHPNNIDKDNINNIRKKQLINQVIRKFGHFNRFVNVKHLGSKSIAQLKYLLNV